jgi:hypothetical protein
VSRLFHDQPDAEVRALAFACPQCGAKAGDRCTSLRQAAWPSHLRARLMRPHPRRLELERASAAKGAS